jgi:hypothetical protein
MLIISRVALEDMETPSDLERAHKEDVEGALGVHGFPHDPTDEGGVLPDTSQDNAPVAGPSESVMESSIDDAVTDPLDRWVAAGALLENHELWVLKQIVSREAADPTAAAFVLV